MSVVFSGSLSGYFKSTGLATTIPLTTSCDWMYVKNITVSYAAGNDTGAEFYWQRGMTQGRGTIYKKTAVTDALQVGQIAAREGFYLIDSTLNIPGPAIATTGITGALPPVVTTGNTTGLLDGDIVRLFSPAGALQLGGMDFTVFNVVTNTSFELINMPAIAAATPAIGTYRRIPYDPYFYPRNRLITKISQATFAIVTMSVTHSFTVGQRVRFIIPTLTAASYGMNELDGVSATIVDINVTDGTSLNTIVVDIDTTGYTAFSLPLTTDALGTFAQVVPIGEQTSAALYFGTNMLGDATRNEAVRGMQLISGANSPAGIKDDEIYWVVGKSFNQ
jgi:hypothetical protein